MKPICIKIALLVLIFAANAKAQIIISGSISDPEGVPFPGAMIRIYKPDSTSILQFCQSDTAGHWQLALHSKGVYVIKIAHLGSETWVKRFTVSSDSPSIFKVALLPEIRQIGLVQINAKQVGIIVRGDTSIYNLGQFIDSTEFDLKDILNKLPQIKVDENGSILYKGKRVDLALTEGKDIFGQLHKQMTEGIKAEDVQSVQIISNIKMDPSERGGADKDLTAINILLTEHARNKINGDAGLSTNGKQFHELNGTLYKSGKGFGFSSLLRGNSIGKSTLSGADFFALMDIEDLAETRDYRSLEQYSLHFAPVIDLKSNRDWFAFGRIVSGNSSPSSFKASVLYTNYYRYSERTSIRYYPGESSVFAGFKRQTHPSTLLQAAFQNKYKKNRFSCFLKIPFQIITVKKKHELLGILDSTNLENFWNSRNQNFNFSPLLIATYQLDSTQTFIFKTQVKLQSIKSNTGLLSDDFLFNLPENEINQFFSWSESDIRTSLNYNLKIFKHTFDIKYTFESNRFQYQLETVPTTGKQWYSLNQVNDYWQKWQLAFRKNRGNFRYSAETEWQKLYRMYDAGQPLDWFLLFLGKTGVYYDINKNHNIYLNFTSESATAPPIHLVRAWQITGENTVATENVDSNFITKSSSIRLNYSNRDPSGQWDYWGGISFTVQKNGLAYSSMLNENFILSASYLSPQNKIFTTEFKGSYTIKYLNSRVSFDGKSEWAQTFSLFRGNLVNSDIQKFSGRIILTYSAIKKLSLSASFSPAYTIQSYVESDFMSQFWSYFYMFGAQFKSKRWRFTGGANYQERISPTQKNRLWLINASLEYEIKKWPLRLKLEGRNLANLNGTNYIWPDFNVNYIGYDSFQSMGGQILAGAAYIF